MVDRIMNTPLCFIGLHEVKIHKFWFFLKIRNTIHRKITIWIPAFSKLIKNLHAISKWKLRSKQIIVINIGITLDRYTFCISIQGTSSGYDCHNIELYFSSCVWYQERCTFYIMSVFLRVVSCTTSHRVLQLLSEETGILLRQMLLSPAKIFFLQ